MKVKTIEKKGYKLHLLKNKDFKTVLVKIVFWNEIKKEELSIRNMLVNSLLFSSLTYNTSRKMAIKKEELYNADVYSRNYRKANQVLSEISLSVLDDKYTEKGNLKDALAFASDCINKPNIIGGKFDDNLFKINYEKLKTAIVSERENSTYYAFKRFREEIGEDKIFTSSLVGTLEDLEKITPNTLADYYHSFLKNNHIDIFVIGDINFKEIEKDIEELFDFEERDIPYTKLDNCYDKDFTEKEEDSKFSQSKLFMGGSIKEFTEHEKLYEGLLYNIIFGNSPNSKLFQNVREKNSFAYTVSSSINRLDGLFHIYSGISYKNYEKTKEEIFKQLEEMRQGKFSLKDLKDAKEVVLSIMNEVDEYQGSILDHYFNRLYFGSEEIKKQKEEIKKVTKEDLVTLSNKIKIDTIFLLKEEEK